jgi:GNAT superfamily N-acetyltransferase
MTALDIASPADPDRDLRVAPPSVAPPPPTTHVLRDARAVTVRPLAAGDVERLRRLFGRLSPTTVYLRFFQAIPAPSDKALSHFAGVDHDRREALAAVIAGEIVGVARYDVDPGDPTRAEAAIVVQDDLQHHGLGALLLSQLSQVAKTRHVTTLTGTVLGENRRMLSLAHRLSTATTARLQHGEYELAIPIA